MHKKSHVMNLNRHENCFMSLIKLTMSFGFGRHAVILFYTWIAQLWHTHLCTAGIYIQRYEYRIDCGFQRCHKNCTTRTWGNYDYCCWKSSTQIMYATMVSWASYQIRKTMGDISYFQRQIYRPFPGWICLNLTFSHFTDCASRLTCDIWKVIHCFQALNRDCLTHMYDILHIKKK